MYINNSTTDKYPKTLLIRNEKGGAIWQVYHVQAEHEAERLSSNASRDGFADRQLVDYDPSYEETWPNWRDTPGGKKIICKHVDCAE